MKRREFLQLGATSLLFSRRVFAQGAGRRIGVLICTTPEDSAGIAFLDACQQGLRQEGWVEGLNLNIDVRYTSGLRELSREYALDLVGLRPDAMVCSLSANAEETARIAPQIPMVFVGVADPARAGLVENFARPGGQATGFTGFEPSHGSKWLALLKEIAPSVRRVKFIYHPDPRASAYAYFPFMQDAAAQLGMEVATVHARNANEIDGELQVAGPPEESGVIFGSDGFLLSNRALCIATVNLRRLAAIFPYAEYAREGGLIAYSFDMVEEFRSAGAVVGRILQGVSPGDIPVQNPSRFTLSINLRTARALGIEVPVSLLASADQLIE